MSTTLVNLMDKSVNARKGCTALIVVTFVTYVHSLQQEHQIKIAYGDKVTIIKINWQE